MENKLSKDIIALPAAEYRKRHERAPDDSKPYELTFRYSTILRVQPTGKKTLWCQHGRGKRTKIGDAGVITIERAEHVARQILNEVSDYGRPLKGGLKKSKLGGFVEDVYLPWLKANRRRVDKTESDVRRCFKSMWDTKLTDVDRGSLDEYVETRTVAGASAATIRREMNNLQRIMTLALSRGYIREHPFKGWERPKVEEGGAPRYLDDTEEARLRTALADRDERAKRERVTANKWRAAREYELLPELPHYADHLTPMVLVSLGTGLRYGELTGLEWQHVNMNFKVLTVTAATAKGQKTRHVPMNDEVLDALAKWKEQTSGGKGLVFMHIDGSRIGTVKTAWLALLKEAKIEGFRWHDLRHTFASKLVQRGASLAVVRDLLGHGDFKLTLRYAHINERQKTDAVALLQDAAPKPAASGKRRTRRGSVVESA